MDVVILVVYTYVNIDKTANRNCMNCLHTTHVQIFTSRKIICKISFGTLMVSFCNSKQFAERSNQFEFFNVIRVFINFNESVFLIFSNTLNKTNHIIYIKKKKKKRKKVIYFILLGAKLLCNGNCRSVRRALLVTVLVLMNINTLVFIGGALTMRALLIPT